MVITESQTKGDAALPRSLPIVSGVGTKNFNRQNRRLIQVEATVYWWRTDEVKSSSAGNKFCVMPAEPVRFRCIGSLAPKYPRRFRVDLAQALDRLPALTGLELKAVGVSLATAISKKLGVDVAPINGQLIDVQVPDGTWV